MAGSFGLGGCSRILREGLSGQSCPPYKDDSIEVNEGQSIEIEEENVEYVLEQNQVQVYKDGKHRVSIDITRLEEGDVAEIDRFLEGEFENTEIEKAGSDSYILRLPEEKAYCTELRD